MTMVSIGIRYIKSQSFLAFHNTVIELEVAYVVTEFRSGTLGILVRIAFGFLNVVLFSSFILFNNVVLFSSWISCK